LDCGLDQAAKGCSNKDDVLADEYHLCTRVEIGSFGYQVALRNGWLTYNLPIWTQSDLVNLDKETPVRFLRRKLLKTRRKRRQILEKTRRTRNRQKKRKRNRKRLTRKKKLPPKKKAKRKMRKETCRKDLVSESVA